MAREKICFRTDAATDEILEYMRELAGCTMSTLVKTILRNACLEFNATGVLPIISKKQNKNGKK